MAKVSISEYSKALEEFTKNAEKFKVSKAEVTENLSQLKEAIELFERLAALRESFDPDSPRAKNYFNLQQSIASINEGWQNNQALLSREAQLADASNYSDRLTPEEASHLKRLMRSNKLKNFVQFLDAENPAAFQTLKSIVQLESAGPQIVQGDTTSQTLSRRLSSVADLTWDEIQREHDALQESDNRSTPDLVEMEEERQEKEEKQEVMQEVKDTSAKVQEAVGNISEKSVDVKVKSKKPKKKTESTNSFFNDLKTFLKWTVGAGAAIAGVAWLLDDVIKYLTELDKEVREIKGKVTERENYYKDNEQEFVGKFDNSAEAGAVWKRKLQDAKIRGAISSEFKITSDQINMLNISRARGTDSREWEDAVLSVLDALGGDITQVEVAAIEAIRDDKQVAVVPNTSKDFWGKDRGKLGYAFNVNALLDQNAADPAAFAATSYNAAREADAQARLRKTSARKPLMDAALGMSTNSPVQALVWSKLANSLGGWYDYFRGDVRNKVQYSDEELSKLSVGELERATLPLSNKFLKEWLKNGLALDDSVEEGDIYADFGRLLPNSFNIGEYVQASTTGKFERLRQAQASGSAEAIAAELTRLSDRTYSKNDPLVRDIQKTDDYGVDNQRKFDDYVHSKNPNYNPYDYPTAPASLTPGQSMLDRVHKGMQQTLIQQSTWFQTSDTSNQQTPGEL